VLDMISIGAVNMDLIARVGKFPAKDEEVAVQDLEIFHGGSAANVAVGVSRLGHTSGFVGVVGTDPFGDMLVERLNEENVDITHLVKMEGTSGIVFGAVNEAGERILYSSKGVSSKFERSFIPVEYIRKTRFLHLTSMIGDKAIDALEFASGVGYNSNIKVILDPGSILAEKGLAALAGILRNSYIVIPSETEAYTLTGFKGERAAGRLLEYGPQVVIITRGSKGCLLVTRHLVKGIPGLKSEVVDTTGAGDSFAAGLMTALLENKELEEAVEFANMIASISVIRKGARTTPVREEV